MTEPELVQLAAQNLEATYFSIGSATPEARIDRRDGYSMCLGRLDHPVGNFAVVHRITPAVAIELSSAARQRASFNVYVPSAAPTPHYSRLLIGAGFRKSYRLVQMAAEPRPHGSEVALVEAAGPDDRLRISNFMTLQFFARQKLALREEISYATAGSGLNLYEVCRAGKVIGAAMVSRHAGLFGIYNLCIEARRRRRGFGGDAVKCLLTMAAVERLPSVLQAEPGLASWYARFGFKEVGTVEVFALDR